MDQQINLVKVYDPSDQLILEFGEGDKPYFHSRVFESDMVKRGIFIPPVMQQDYDNKIVIFAPIEGKTSKEEYRRMAFLFKKAFLEWYFPTEMEKLGYHT